MAILHGYRGFAVSTRRRWTLNFCKINQKNEFIWLLEVGLCADLRQANVHTGPDGCAQVGRAESEPSQTIVSRERNFGFDGLHSLDQTLQHLAHIASVLHGDDPQVLKITKV